MQTAAEAWQVPEGVAWTRRTRSSGSKDKPAPAGDSAGDKKKEEEKQGGFAAEPGRAALGGRLVTELTAVYLDCMTLEFVPRPVEEAYHSLVFKQWRLLFIMAMLLGTTVWFVLTARALASPDIFGGRLRIFPCVLWPLCGVAAVLPTMLVLIPGHERNARAAARVYELLFGIVGPSMAMFAANETHTLVRSSWCMAEGGVAAVQCDVIFAVAIALRRWHLVQDGSLLLSLSAVVLALQSPFAPSLNVLVRAWVPQLVHCAVNTAASLYERRQRRRFLTRAASRQPSSEQDAIFSATAAPPPAPRRGRLAFLLGGSCSGPGEEALAARLHRARRVASLWTDRPAFAYGPTIHTLHFHIRGLGPLQVPAGLRAALSAALAAQGFALRGSGVMDGSLRLVALYGSAADSPLVRASLDVDALLSQLTALEPELRDSLLSDVCIQHGTLLLIVRNGRVVDRQPARAPETVDWQPHVLPAGLQAELAVQLRLQKPPPPKQLFVVLRHIGSSLALDVPCMDLTEVHASELVINNTVMLERGGSQPLDVYLLEVCDGEVFSEAVPVLSCGCPQLFRELKSLDKFLAQNREGGLMSSASLLWTMKCLADFSAALRGQSLELLVLFPQQQRQQQCFAASSDKVQKAGPKPLSPPELLATAAAVRHTAPQALHLACLLGLPSLVELLLQDVPLAFLLLQQQQQQLEQAAASQQDAVGNAQEAGTAEQQVAVPLPATGDVDPQGEQLQGAKAQAFSALLSTAGACGMWVTTPLHLAVVSESSATVRALQAGAQRWSSELNWDAAAATLINHGGSRAELSAMALAAQKLPRTGRVVRQALLGGGARAAASWLAAAGSGLAGKVTQAQAVRSWERSLTALAQSGLMKPPPLRLRLARRLSAAAAYLLASCALHLLPSGLPLADSWPRALASATTSAALALATTAVASLRGSGKADTPQTLLNILLQVAGCCSPLNMPWNAYCSVTPVAQSVLAAVFVLHHVIMPVLAPLPPRDQVATTLLIVAVRTCMCVQLHAASLEHWQAHAALGGAALGWALIPQALRRAMPSELRK